MGVEACRLPAFKPLKCLKSLLERPIVQAKAAPRPAQWLLLGAQACRLPAFKRFKCLKNLLERPTVQAKATPRPHHYPKATSLPQGMTRFHHWKWHCRMEIAFEFSTKSLQPTNTKKKPEKMKLFVKLCQRVPSKGTHPSGLQETALSSTLSLPPSLSPCLYCFTQNNTMQYHAV